MFDVVVAYHAQTQPYLDVLNNSGVLAVHSDPLGVQARKLALGADGRTPLPWLVGLEDCTPRRAEYLSRSFEPVRPKASDLYL